MVDHCYSVELVAGINATGCVIDSSNTLLSKERFSPNWPCHPPSLLLLVVVRTTRNQRQGLTTPSASQPFWLFVTVLCVNSWGAQTTELHSCIRSNSIALGCLISPYAPKAFDVLRLSPVWLRAITTVTNQNGRDCSEPSNNQSTKICGHCPYPDTRLLLVPPAHLLPLGRWCHHEMHHRSSR